MQDSQSTYTEVPSEHPLTGYVDNYWEIQNPNFGLGHPILPRGSLDLIFNLAGGPGYEKVLRPGSTNGRTDLQETTDWLKGYGVERQSISSVWLLGLHDRSVIVRTPFESSRGRVHLIAARLRPIATQAIFGVPAHLLTNRVVNAEDVIGDDIHHVYSDLLSKHRLEERVKVLNNYLLTRISSGSERLSPLAIKGAQLIENSSGMMSVAAICDTLGVSRKHMAFVCKEYLGMTPKRYLRLARYRAASEFLSTNTDASFAEAAAMHGYVDQSHMVNEFSRFTGLTPSQLY